MSGKSEPDFAGGRLSASVRRRNNSYEAFVAVGPEAAGLALLVASGALAVRRRRRRLIGGGTQTFAPGETSKTISVPVIGDRLVESNESVLVNLSSPTHASISDAQGIGPSATTSRASASAT